MTALLSLFVNIDPSHFKPDGCSLLFWILNMFQFKTINILSNKSFLKLTEPQNSMFVLICCSYSCVQTC